MADRFTIDFETYYDKDFSLKKMTPVEYILDPRFEVIMLSVKRPGKPSFNLEGDKIQQFFNLLNPDDTIVLTYNSLFDMCICAWRYGFIPKLMVDVMGMVRAWHGHALRSVALAVAAPYMGVGFKGTEVAKMVGLHAADIKAAGLWPQYVTYCNGDSELTEKMFDKMMAEGFPLSELRVLHIVLMMCVHPQFELNEAELAQHLQDIKVEKDLLLTRAMMIGAAGKETLMSNDKFAELLTSLGIDPPRKISPTTGRETYAFSKSDQEFTDLEEHPDIAVQTAVSARLGHKSTIEETRTERFLSIARLAWPASYLSSRGRGGGTVFGPMPLRYGAAHTHRLGGDWKLNVQNFPSRGVVNHLKRALMAPAGYKVCNIDSSQIEARIVAWLCGEWELLEQFARGMDPYRIFAAKVFHIDVSHVTAEQRFLGKTSILGLGFGLGWVKFKHQVRVKSLEAVKLSGKGQELILQDQQSLLIVNTYRSTYPGVPTMWRALNAAISILAGGPGVFSIGPCTFSKGRVSLPNGLYLHYHNLRQTADGWVYDHAGKPRRLYGGALLENIVQALARCIVMDAAVRIAARLDRFKILLALQVHDALVYLVPDAAVPLVGEVMKEEMNRRPTWAANLPLSAELKSGQTYGDAK
jgi:DNA polymerase